MPPPPLVPTRPPLANGRSPVDPPTSASTLGGATLASDRLGDDLVALHAIEPERLLEGVDVAEGDQVGHSSLVDDPTGRHLARGIAARAAGVDHPDPPAPLDRRDQR